jgi:hypothetical protein
MKIAEIIDVTTSPDLLKNMAKMVEERMKDQGPLLFWDRETKRGLYMTIVREEDLAFLPTARPQ